MKLDNYPLETRQRWFAEFNCWRIPSDFPFPLPDFTGREREQYDDPQWREAWNAVQASLTPAESSLGWWLYELGKAEDEWRLWWNERKRA